MGPGLACRDNLVDDACGAAPARLGRCSQRRGVAGSRASLGVACALVGLSSGLVQVRARFRSVTFWIMSVPLSCLGVTAACVLCWR